MNKIKLVLIDDNEVFVNNLASYLERRPEFIVLGAFSDPREGFKALITQDCDVCILDVIMPVLDGIAVLEKLQAAPMEKRPKVITLSAVRNDAVLHRLLELGASYCIVKPCEPKMVAERVLGIMETDNCQGVYSGARQDIKTVSVEERVVRLMNSLGIQHNLKGFRYLKEAIMMVIDDEGNINGMTNKIYPAIARKFDTKPSRVERAMRHAIETAWSRGALERKNELFGYTIDAQKGKPTNSEFIAMLSDKIRMDLR